MISYSLRAGYRDLNRGEMEALRFWRIGFGMSCCTAMKSFSIRTPTPTTEKGYMKMKMIKECNDLVPKIDWKLLSPCSTFLGTTSVCSCLSCKLGSIDDVGCFCVLPSTLRSVVVERPGVKCFESRITSVFTRWWKRQFSLWRTIGEPQRRWGSGLCRWYMGSAFRLDCFWPM